MAKKKSAPKGAATGVKTIAINKKARHNYELQDAFEAGISLTGPEVKSIRAGQVSFKDGYVKIIKKEAWLIGVHIAPYENAGYVQQDPDRDRKLLLHGYEIERLQAKSEQKGLSLVPTKMYFKFGRVKVEVALGQGKKTFDKKEALKQKDIARDAAREMARYK